MCTIMTLTKQIFENDYDAVVERILIDATVNPDGFALALFNGRELMTTINSMSIDTVLYVLSDPTIEWTRMILHCRMTTQGATNTLNTHGFKEGQFIYYHNGTISSPEAKLFEVDSQAIGRWLEAGIDNALFNLGCEAFANVFIVDTETGIMTTHRSEHNTLYTDHEGNYSTKPVGSIKEAVPHYTVYDHDLQDDDSMVWFDVDDVV